MTGKTEMTKEENHMTDNISDCMICGAELFYIPDIPVKAKCFFCGREYVTNVFCMNGHYVCDECHRGRILEIIEKTCMESNISDPAELLGEIFMIPGLHMHGPEYHSIVPAVIVAAYGNMSGTKNAADIKEALRRGKDIGGGVCGTHGACGAAVGAGTAYSVINKVTPLSAEERGAANKVTAAALEAVAAFGGPRCCKRDSMAAVDASRDMFGIFPEAPEVHPYVCSQYKENKTCIGLRCPYHP